MNLKPWLIGMAFALSALLNMAPAAAQTPPGLVTNGCGSGRFGFLVPNSTLISACQFKSSCDQHDRCYSRCLIGGDLAGSSTCSVADAKVLRRQTCDVSLQRSIISENVGKPVCSLYASIYRFAVQLMGEEFFNGVGGPQPVAFMQLHDLLLYIEHNPDAFDAATLEKAFLQVDDGGLVGVDYEFWLFRSSPPRLVARRAGKELFQVQGQVQTP